LRETISAQPPQRHRRRIFAWFFIICHADRMTRTAICLKAENMSRFRLPLFQISAFPLIAPPLPLEKVPVNSHRLDAAWVIRFRAVIKKSLANPIARLFNPTHENPNAKSDRNAADLFKLTF